MKFKVIALAALMGISGMAAQANELPDGPHIVTSGTASVDAVPDIATLAIEVNVAAKDAATAKKQADERVAQYISFLELNQIAKKDISSANLRTQPDYDYQDGKSILKGYRAVRTVEVTLRQLDKLNSLLDGALKAGLNEIRSVSLGVAQPDAIKTKRVRQRLITRFIRRRNWRTAFIVNWGRYIACATMFPTISPAQWCG